MGLETVDVSKRFKGLAALDKVSLSLAKGEILGLIGPNGSGKTTFLNILSGVLEPSEGTIRIDGRDLGRLTPRDAALLGIRRTFQNIRLFADMTVLETVEVAAAALGSGDRRKVALGGLSDLGLLKYRDRIGHELSYGLQRRLEIARAIAGRIEFLLLDEPAAGMNDIESADIVTTIRSIRDRYDCGIMLIDHDLKVIMNACDRVAALNQGQLISEGTPQHVRSDPAVISAYLG